MALVRVGTAAVCLLLLAPGGAAGAQASAQQTKIPTLPGARLALAAIARVKPPVGEGFNYRLQATGLPRGRTYVLEVRRVSGEVGRMPIGALRVDAAGRPVAENGVRLEQIVFGTGPIYQGEPLEPALVAEDGSGQVATRIVPAPIEASGARGCRLSVELMDPTGNVFRITGEGFEPGEEVRTPHRSEDEVMADLTKRASPTGGFEFIMLPAVVGKTGGAASISATGQACAVPALAYKWGTAMERASSRHCQSPVCRPGGGTGTVVEPSLPRCQ